MIILFSYLKEIKSDNELFPFASISNIVRDNYDVRSIGNAVPKSFLRRLLVILEDEAGVVYYAQKPDSIYMINRVYGCKERVMEVFGKIDGLLKSSPAVIVSVDDDEYIMSRTMPKRIAIPREKMRKVDITELL
ncbi:MAG: hypothetical protein E7197_06300 [Anaerovibrio sp.]|uniref:hypothetical protein n=1 Tax=Anaerovibrio sp. TaxID=1872532 RepID=UPI0025C394B2|nr:hypothetical protein [Anaerovibrio sp.]MBE6099651.1 hypothetical protein [Anaerovibrio sp.]